MKLKIDKDGYEVVILSRGGKNKTYRIHRVVAEHFIDNPMSLPQINHKDECRDNNVVENLEWCDSKYNNNYGNSRYRKSCNGCIPIMQVSLDGSVINEWRSMSDAQRNTGIDKTSISRACRGKQKVAGGFIWRYLPKWEERNE